jgi:hypothetical protein
MKKQIYIYYKGRSGNLKEKIHGLNRGKQQDNG